MVRFRGLFALLFGIAVVGGLNASGGDSLKIGDAAPEFKNLPGTDGKSYSSGDFKQDVLVLVVTCNHCPVAMAYEEHMVNFAKKYSANENAKVGFVAINVNNRPEDNLVAMKSRAKDKNFNFVYLHDQSQDIAKKLSARVTPEFYVFDKSRKLVYWGAMDDEMLEDKVKIRYLEPAVEATLKGKTVPTAMTKAFGCGVEYGK